MKFIVRLFFLLLISVQVTGQVNFEKDFFRDYPREQFILSARNTQSLNTGNYDAIFCRLEFQVDPAVYYINGKATTYFKPVNVPLKTMYFDFTSQLEIESVKYRGNDLNWEKTPLDELKVEFPVDLAPGILDSVQISYFGQPGSSGFGSFATALQCGEDAIPSMWTLSEPYGSKHWWPCKHTLNDKYDSLQMVITTPSRYRAASNGLLISEVESGNNKIYNWKHKYPIPAYLAAFAVSEYKVYSDWVPLENNDSLEILNYIYPCNLDYAKSRTPYTVPVMQFFREFFGEYPYIREKYGHCNFGWGGGMEHSTMSFMGGFSDLLISHELAHQWFGDKITCGSWAEIWLNEGFATYLEGLTYDFGVNPTKWTSWKNTNLTRALNSPTGSVYVDDTTSVNRIFSGNLSYAKGAYLLHMLRWMMGDDNFFTAVYNYISDPELVYGYAKTPDLQYHLEQASGMNLDEFFKDWLYGKGFPNYEVVWSKNGNKVDIVINQNQSHPSVEFFNMPVPIHLMGLGRDTLVVLNPEFSGQLFSLNVGFPVGIVAFDPDKWICGTSTVITGTFDEQPAIVRIYPNPATDYVRIDPGEGITLEEIRLYDTAGRLLFTENRQINTSGSSEVILPDIVTGTYLLKILSSKGLQTQKLLVK